MSQSGSVSTSKQAGKEVLFGVIRASTYHFTLTYLIPIGVPAVFAVAGILQGLPWMQIAVGAGLIFATVTTGMVRLDDWREKRRTEDKLSFEHVRIGTADAPAARAVLGLYFRSSASLTMEVEVAEIRTQVGARVPAKRTYDKTVFEIPAHGYFFFDDHAIETGPFPANAPLTGMIEYTLLYGPRGNRKYKITGKKNVTLVFDASARYTGGNWSDAA